MSYLDSTYFIQSSQENLLKAEGGPKEYSIDFSNIAIGQALIAIAKELKRFNDEIESENRYLEVLSDEDRQELGG